MRACAIIVLVCLMPFGFFLSAQSNKTALMDSLTIEITKPMHDTIRVAKLCKLAYYIGKSDPVLMQKYLDEALKLSVKNNFQKGKISVYNEMGNYQKQIGNYTKALEYLLKALDLANEIHFAEKAVSINTDIGNIFFSQNDIAGSRKYYQNALEEARRIGFKHAEANCLHNLAGCYFMEGKYDECMDYLKQHIKIISEMNLTEELANAIGNLGGLYGQLGKKAEALTYLDSAIRVCIRIKDYNLLPNLYVNKATILIETGKTKEGFEFFDLALDYARNGNNKEVLNDIYKNMAVSYSLIKDFENAYKYRTYNYLLSDSLFNEEFSRQLNEMQAKYKSDIKDKELKQVAAEKKTAELDAKQKSNQRNFMFVGLVIITASAFFIFRGYRQKKKANQEISKQKELIEVKNKEILDSISYAKRIQTAILPPQRLVKEFLPESFILYKPKDIVAGDFYWMEHTGDLIMFAAADCTGHGVPGAMVSVVCHNGLNRSVREFGITDPGKILDKTREIIIQEFEKSDEEVKDGMDISLCVLNLKTNELKWAGANNPLWVIRKEETELTELKPDKQPIGKYAEPMPFTTQTIKLGKGDNIYVFTDGYQDQFGGDKGKKFKASKMKELLMDIKGRSMDKQREAINQAFESWKGQLEQVDDVCVIGVRV